MSSDESVTTDRIHELEAKVVELTALVERMSTPAPLPAVIETHATEVEPAPTSSRRGMLKLAGAAAAAGAAAVVASRATPVAAADGDPIKVAQTTSSTAANRESTQLVYANTTAGPQVDSGLVFPLGSKTPANIFTVRDQASGPIFIIGDPGRSGYPSAVAGYAVNVISNGVYGFSSVEGYGVVGYASGSKGIGILARGTKANLHLQAEGGAPSARTETYALGEIIADSTGALWLCVVAGAPGTWRKLSGPTAAGAFHAITPTRVYDSRVPAPTPGALVAGTNRDVSVKDGRDISNGNVTAADLIPAGATAITANVTVAATNKAGFLAINPQGNTTVAAATVNWSASGQILNNGVTLTINPTNRQVTVIAGGDSGASTDFIIDVTGYFL